MTNVIRSTVITIRTRRFVVSVYARAVIIIAKIIGTRVVIVTVLRGTRNTSSFVTNIVRSTGIVIIARSMVVGVRTGPGITIATIVSTHVVIIARFSYTRNAYAFTAHIVHSTGIIVATGAVVERVYTRAIIITSIVGTLVFIVAVLERTRNATSLTTSVRRSTSIAVITRSIVVSVYARAIKIARIISTLVSIVAVLRGTTYTRSFITSITRSTGITVRARSGIVGVHAYSRFVTIVVGTCISVVTFRYSATDARSFVTSITRSTSILVIASGMVVGVQAGTSMAITAIVCTHVAIITRFWSTRNTDSGTADIASRAGITIRTRGGIVYIHALS
jgi:hypothetical protein